MWGWSPSGPRPTAAFKGASTGSNEVLSQDVLDNSRDVTGDLLALMRIKVHWGSSSQELGNILKGHWYQNVINISFCNRGYWSVSWDEVEQVLSHGDGTLVIHCTSKDYQVFYVQVLTEEIENYFKILLTMKHEIVFLPFFSWSVKSVSVWDLVKLTVAFGRVFSVWSCTG